MAYNRLKNEDLHLELKHFDLQDKDSELYDGVPQDISTVTNNLKSGAYTPLDCDEDGDVEPVFFSKGDNCCDDKNIESSMKTREVSPDTLKRLPDSNDKEIKECLKGNVGDGINRYMVSIYTNNLL